MTMYKLIIEDDEGKTTVVPLLRDEITIGRKEGNTIRLTERNVSRRHAKLLCNNGTVLIEDLDSYNGIRINGARIIGRSLLNEGDRIQIGDYQLALKLDRAAQASAAREVATTSVVQESRTPTQVVSSPISQTAVTPSGETNGRLVVVSSNFAGKSFLLDKSSVTIGRTEENDVVIGHRSISRHHAKVVRDQDHFHVIDLQSANGVRVNGEEYGKVELHRGDLIDLGHVRLRFVEPGEDFVFERDAVVVDVGSPAASRGSFGMGLLVGCLALAGGAFLLVKVLSSGGRPPAQVHAVVDTESQVAKLLLEADRSLKAEDWDSAIAKCNEALRVEPNQELARDKEKQAQSEKKNRDDYAKFSAAAEREDPDGAVAAFGELSENSIYRARGNDRYAQVKRAYIRVHLDAARQAKTDGDCEKARQQAEAVLRIAHGNRDAEDVGRSCGEALRPATAKPSQAGLKSHSPSPSPSKMSGVKAPKSAVDHRTPAATDLSPHDEGEISSPNGSAAAEKKLQEAQDAYVHGQYTTAIELARSAHKEQPSKAWRIIGASHCFLKDKDGAQAAWGKLDAQGRQFLKYVCSRNSITLP